MTDRTTRESETRRAVEAIRRRVLDHLHLGLLTPGTRLPSVRSMAGALRLSQKAVLVAYRILEGESVVTIRPRSGVFVATPSAFAGENEAREWLVESLVEARRHGIPLTMAAAFLERSLRTIQLRAVVIDRNADQLWSIREELAREYGIAASTFDLDEFSSHDNMLITDAIVAERVDLVVTTAFELQAVRKLLPPNPPPICAVTMCTDMYAEVRRLLLSRDVYFVVADRRLGQKLRAMFDSPRLRVVLHDEALKIPPSAPLYVTRLARAQLSLSRADHPMLARSLPEARVFSEETARELTRLILTANERQATFRAGQFAAMP